MFKVVDRVCMSPQIRVLHPLRNSADGPNYMRANAALRTGNAKIFLHGMYIVQCTFLCVNVECMRAIELTATSIQYILALPVDILVVAKQA